MAIHPRLLLILYIGVVSLPVALAWLGARPARGVFDELASGAGMLAFAVVLVEFVLSGRFRSVSAKVGMDVTMRLHQLLARTALALAVIHPFLYRSPFGPALPWDATRQLTLTSDAGALATGALAWVLLPALVLLGIARSDLSYRYETWRLMHGLGALAIAGLLLHHTLQAGRYSQDPVIAAVWGALFVLAALTLVQVYLVGPLRRRMKPWKVHSVRPVALKTWELTLEPEGHDGFAYSAGQFAWISVGERLLPYADNPFSISSAPSRQGRLEFVIKELGDFTRSVGGIRKGMRAHVDGPHGNLTLTGRGEPGIALIAGGVGIAPLLGILRQLHGEGDKRPTVLVYGNRVEEQIVDREALDALAAAHGTQLVHVVSEPAKSWKGERGMVDAALIRRLFAVPERRRWLYVMCGPAPMMEAVEDALIGLGVPASRILSERFQYD